MSLKVIIFRDNKLLLNLLLDESFLVPTLSLVALLKKNAKFGSDVNTHHIKRV